jgi:hypothetical protein
VCAATTPLPVEEQGSAMRAQAPFTENRTHAVRSVGVCCMTLISTLQRVSDEDVAP